jgi:hypothetical protein
MFIILTSLTTGKKIRINTNKIVKYNEYRTDTRQEHSPDFKTTLGTEMIVQDSTITFVRESVEEVDEILSHCYVTVYEKK